VPARPDPSTAADEPSAGLRAYLLVTAFLAGAAVLVVEILGAKMLTPYFGTSHYVWTAQIGITLLSLAAGYWLGGRVAHRPDGLALVYGGLAGAAVWLAGTVAFREPLAYACLRLPLAAGSLAAAAALFFVPLALMAMVGPCFVRTLTASLHTMGREVGRMSALSTVGSVTGVMLASYVLIPNLRDSVAMLGTCALLLGLTAMYFARWHRRGGAAVLAAAGAAALLGAAALRIEALRSWGVFREVDRANSHFGLLQVLEEPATRRRLLANDFLVQNTYDPASGRSLSLFTEMLHGLSRAYTPRLETALCLGLGVGIVPMRLAAEGVRVDAVEINPDVVPLAERWFGFRRDAVNLHLDDARHFLRVTTNRYDTVQLDAFLGDSCPTHLMSREAFAAMRGRLTPDGTLVINTFAATAPGRDFFAGSLQKTLAAVFRSVVIHPGRNGNTFFVASDRTPLTVVHPPDPAADVPPPLAPLYADTFAAAVREPLPGGLVLTDAFNPVEFRDAAQREQLRRALALGMAAR
jgi:predicted membrane-bound spermidine synthase